MRYNCKTMGQLLGALLLFYAVSWSGDIDAQLNSNNGSTKFEVKDSDGSAVMDVDSDGNITADGGVSRYGFYYAHQTTAPTGLAAGSFSTLDLDDIEVVDADFYSEGGGTVTIQKAGLYRISIASDLASSGGTREFAQVALFINGGQVADVTSSMYARETTGVEGTGTSRTCLKTLAVNDLITVRFKPDATTADPKNNGSSLTMEFIR